MGLAALMYAGGMLVWASLGYGIIKVQVSIEFWLWALPHLRHKIKVPYKEKYRD